MKKVFVCVLLAMSFCCLPARAAIDDQFRTNIGFPIGYAENFDQTVEKAKLTAILTLLPDARRAVYMGLGANTRNFSQDDIAAMAIGSLKINSLDVTAPAANVVSVAIDARVDSNCVMLLSSDARLLNADKQLLADIRRTLNISDELNRAWLAAADDDKQDIAQKLADNRIVAKQELRFLNAFWFMAANENDDAAREFSGILATDKNNAQALLWRGIAYYYMDKYALAMNDFTAAATDASVSQAAYYYLGSCYYVQDKYDLAIDAYNKAASIKSNEPDAKVYLYRGNCYRKQSNYDMAISDYTKTIAIDANCADAYSYRGDCYLYSGKYADAAKDYDVVIKMNKADGYLYFNRGAIYLKNGDVDNAISCFEQTTKLLPDYADGYYNKALAYDQKLYLVKNGKSAGNQSAIIKNALDAYKKFIQIADPKRPEVQKAKNRVKALSATAVLDI